MPARPVAPRCERLELRAVPAALSAPVADDFAAIVRQAAGQAQPTSDLGDNLRSLVVLPDGSVLRVGTTDGTIPQQILLERHHADGSFDGSFGVGGVETLGFGADTAGVGAARQSDGRTRVAGLSRPD